MDIKPVTAAERNLDGRDFFWLWAGVAISLAEIWAGGFLAPLGFWAGLWAILLGHLIGNTLMGLGGMIVWFLHKAPHDEKKPLVLGRYALLFAIVLPVTLFLTIQAGRFTGSPWVVILIGPIVCIPFAAAGLFMAEIYRSFPALSHRLYGLDLLGAGRLNLIGWQVKQADVSRVGTTTRINLWLGGAEDQPLGL